MHIKGDVIYAFSIIVIGSFLCAALPCFNFLDKSVIVQILFLGAILATILLLCRNLFRLKYTAELLFYLVASFLFWVMGGTGSKMNYFFMLFIACLFINYREDVTIKYFFIVAVVVMIAYFIFSKMNMMQEDIIYDRVDGTLRKSLGFFNPNSAAMFFFSFSSMLVITWEKKVDWFFFAGIIVSCYYFTNTRSILICAMVFFICYLFMKKMFKNKKRKILEIFIVSYFICISLITFCFGFLIKMFPILDLISSGRLQLGIVYTSRFVLKNWIIGGTTAKDNFFLAFVAEYGVFFAIWTLSFVVRAVENLIKDENYLYLSYLMAYWIYGLFESLLFNRAIIGVVVFWIIVFKYVFIPKSIKNIRTRRC